MIIQTPRQFYWDTLTKIRSSSLLMLLNKNGVQVPAEDVNARLSVPHPGKEREQVVREILVERMFRFPLREICIRFCWPYDLYNLHRDQYIPSATNGSLVLHPRIDYDRWVVDCPYCAGAEMATDKFYCIGCLNTGTSPVGHFTYEGDLIPVGQQWIKIEWPVRDERALREEQYTGGVE